MQSFRNYRRPHPSKLDTQMTPKNAMRILNTSDSDTLLSGFPTTRLSYEVSIHKNDTHHATTSRDYKYFILYHLFHYLCCSKLTKFHYKYIIFFL